MWAVFDRSKSNSSLDQPCASPRNSQFVLIYESQPEPLLTGVPKAVQCTHLMLTVSIIFSLDRHKRALGSRVSTEGIAVLCLDAWSGWIQVHVQQRILLSQYWVIEETAEEVIGEILHVVREVIQVL